MKETKVPTNVGMKSPQSGPDLDVQTYLGRTLRRLFEAPSEPLPQRWVELLEALAAKDKQHPAVNISLEDALPNAHPWT